MNECKKNLKNAKRRAFRVRHNVKRNICLPRVSVFRSLKHLYAQLVDDQQGKTIASCSSLVLEQKVGDKKAIARSIGKHLAELAKAVNVSAAVFDRGRYRYQGRVRELVEGLREGGLKI